MKLSEVAKSKLRRADIETGQRFGRWTVTGFVAPEHGPTQIAVKCQCGYELATAIGNIRRGLSTQCRRCAWAAMARYSLDGRPATCAELARMAGVPPTSMAARLRSRGNAEDAVRFVRRSTRLVGSGRRLWDGKSLRTLADEAGIKISTLSMRLRAGEAFPHALRPAGPTGARHLLTRSGRPKRLWDYEGRKLSASDMAAMSGLSVVTIRTRLRRGWSVRQTVETKRGMMPRRQS